MGTGPAQAGGPAHLPAGALRVVRWSARYEETVTFYRDTIGLPVLETFHDSYGLDGTILGLPGGQVHLEIVRARHAPYPGGAAGARPVAQIGYWQANGGVTYEDPDGREVVFASWIYLPPGS
jgi:catechol 2,3-dioxygenase-like lactoylglutathione lyase family enzyme